MENEAKKQLESVLASSKIAQHNAIALLTELGEKIELTDWVTITEYARRFELGGPNVVSNWIRRGVIPSENVRDFPELNIRLIKAVAYKRKRAKSLA